MQEAILTVMGNDLERGRKLVIKNEQGIVLLTTKEGKYYLSFFPLSKRYSSMTVRHGWTYRVTLDGATPHLPIEMDRYWPRRWVREFGHGKNHKEYFVICKYTGRKEETLRFSGASEETPRCYVNGKWLQTATYDEFCWEMAIAKRRSHYLSELLDWINGNLQFATLNAAGKRLSASITNKSRTFSLNLKVTWYEKLSSVTIDNGEIIKSHGRLNVIKALAKAIWGHTHLALKEHDVIELIKTLEFNPTNPLI